MISQVEKCIRDGVCLTLLLSLAVFFSQHMWAATADIVLAMSAKATNIWVFFMSGALCLLLSAAGSDRVTPLCHLCFGVL